MKFIRQTGKYACMDHKTNNDVKKKTVKNIINIGHNFEIQSHLDSTCRLAAKKRVETYTDLQIGEDICKRGDGTNEVGTGHQVAELPDY
jgi:hypothetical protein